MNKIAQEGFRITKNLLFRRLLGRASRLVTMPVQLGTLLFTAYTTLGKDGNGKQGFAGLRDIMGTFMRMVKAYTSGNYKGIATKTIVLGVGVLLYLVTPLDLVPDFIPGLGFLDDISLMTWFISSIKDELDKFEQWEIGENFIDAGAGHS